MRASGRFAARRGRGRAMTEQLNSYHHFGDVEADDGTVTHGLHVQVGKPPRPDQSPGDALEMVSRHLLPTVSREAFERVLALFRTECPLCRRRWRPQHTLVFAGKQTSLC